MGKSSLLWRCRRGTREMDLLLQRFIERHYDNLTDAEREQFQKLLDETDLDIMDWIMHRRNPPAAFTKLIEQIRQGNNPIVPDNN